MLPFHELIPWEMFVVRVTERDWTENPRATLTKFVEKILGTGADDALYVAVNASKDKSSDVQLREAAVQLAVFGVPLDKFDPWGVPDPFRLGRGAEVRA